MRIAFPLVGGSVMSLRLIIHDEVLYEGDSIYLFLVAEMLFIATTVSSGWKQSNGTSTRSTA
jgi:hypothetical protein